MRALTDKRPSRRRRKKKSPKPEPKLPTIASVREKVDFIRGGYDPDSRDAHGSPMKLKAFERDRKVSKVIIEDLRRRGTFFREDQLGYYLDRTTRGLIDIGQRGLDLETVLNRYGLNSTEKIFDYVSVELFLYAVNHGQETHIHHFAHLDLPDDGDPVLYIASEDNYIRRITASSNTLVDNGTDGILFLSSEYTAPADVPDKLVVDNGLLRSLILGRIPFDTEVLTREESELLLIGEMFVLLLREAVTDTRPIYAFIGEKGSGKTTAVRMIGMTLYGPDWDVTDVTQNVRDFDTLITTNDFVCFDNADENVNWLNNKLAFAATGGKVARNKLYKTHHLLEYPVISMIATTSRTPCFRRDDVADRLVVMRTVRVERSDQVDFQPDVLPEVLSKRRELWGELIYHLQSILRLMHGTDWRSIRVPGSRLQGFARFTVVVARALGCEQVAFEAWKKIKSAQRDFAAEGEVLFDVLPKWVSQNTGRQITSGELGEELRQIAISQGRDWPYSGGRSLGQKLSHFKDSIRDMFDFHERVCPSRNQTVYQFWPKGERPDSP